MADSPSPAAPRVLWILGTLALLSLLCAAVGLVLWRGALSPPTPPSDMDSTREVDRKNSTGHESAEAVAVTHDGFAVVGHTNSRRPGVRQAWVLDFAGAALRPRWEGVYGEKLGSYGRALVPGSGGGLVVAGEVQVARERFQGWVLALSGGGEVLWERELGTTGFNGFTSLGKLGDGTFVAGGVQDEAGWWVRLSSDGQPLAEARLERLERVTAVAALPSQGFAVAGVAQTSTTGLGTSSVQALDADGRPAWEWRLPAERRGELAALAVLPDGGLVAAGRTQAPGSPDWGLWVVRLDAKGSLLWEHLPADATIEAGHAIAVLPDGSVAVAGDSLKGLADRDARVWRFDAGGGLLWRQSYGGPAQDLARGIARLEDGSLVVAGSTMSRGAGKTDLWVFRLSESGELLGQETSGAP